MEFSQARRQYFAWLAATKELSPHTLRAYAIDISAFEQHLGPTASVRQIDRAALIGFFERQHTLGVSSVSIRRRASALRGFCAWLVKAGLLDGNPLVGMAIAPGRGRVLPRLVARTDLARLLRSLQDAAGIADGPDVEAILRRPDACTTFLAVVLMTTTGLRVNEVVSICCRDVDLDARAIRVLGKGRRERQVFITNGWIKHLTSSYLRARTDLGVRHPRLLFNQLRAPLTTAAMRSRLLRAGINAGLEMRITPHMLRHTAATQLMEAGVDIRYIQRLLGHASLTTTEIYTHVSDGALRRVVSGADVIGGFLHQR